MMIFAVASMLELNVYASTSVTQSPSEYVNITSIDTPAYALPKQRVTVAVQISYSFSRANSSQSEIGISVTRKGGTQESDVFARSRGGVVLYGGLYTYGGIYASANIVTGTREYFIALIIPNQDGLLNLTAHAFYSHGSEWVGSSSMDFVINVSESNGFQLPPTEFTGSITYESTSLSSNFSGTTSESNASVSITPSGDSLPVTLTIPGTTKSDQSNGIFYWIEIDTTDSGGSVQNPLPNYVIELLTNSSTAMLTKGDGTEIKSLQLVVGTSTYTVNGLLLSDLGNANAFSLHVRAMQLNQNFSSKCLSASSDEWASNVEFYEGETNPFVSCYTTPNGYDLLKVWEAPQGGWAPVTIPYQLTISAPVAVQLDGTPETLSNGVMTVPVPGRRAYNHCPISCRLFKRNETAI